MDHVLSFLGSGSFIPHGHCYLWQPNLVWLHLTSDALIALSYYSIPLTLFYFVRNRQDLPFHWIFLLFASFIVACGTTHIAEIWTLWYPTYWLSGAIKVITAIISVFTAMQLVPLVPQALQLPSPAQLEQTNQALQTQIQERLKVEEALRASQTQLEQRVQQRTAELVSINHQLQQEIHERRQIEAEIAALNQDLQNRLTELQTLFEVVPIGILIAQDFEFKNVRANPAFARILGSPVEANISYTPPAEEVRPDYRIFRNGQQLTVEEFPLRYAAIHQVVVEGDEVDIVRGDGTVFNLFGYAAPLLDPQGNTRGAIAAFLDITERKRFEQEQQASEERFRALVEQAPDAIFIADMDGIYIDVNTSACRMLGYQRADLIGKRIVDLLSPEDALQLVAAKESLLSGSMQVEEWTLLCQDGTFVPVEVSTKILPDGRWQMFARDITERKRTETEREKLLAREQFAREQSEAANRIKDEFLAVLSHELRTPLNPILGWIRLLRLGNLSPEKTALALETIERNAQLQTQLIEDLLDVSRILQGKLSLNVEPVDLATIIKAAQETVRLAAEVRSIRIVTDLQASPPIEQVMGDPNRLQQVVWNLLSNAVKFTPAGGQIEITLKYLEAQAQIQVRDTGKGISPSFLPYIFDTFRQEDGKITRKFGGLGLGLAIVRHIVELHGGTVDAQSFGENLGTTFTVRLPLVLATSSVRPYPMPKPCSIDLQDVRVLVVDDEADSRELVAFILEQYGASVTTAATATQALRLFMQSPPDLLLSDIGMPDMDGYQFLRQIRLLHPSQGSSVPAIALTAYAGEINQQQALAAGFQIHLPKPIAPEELLRAIAQLIKASA